MPAQTTKSVSIKIETANGTQTDISSYVSGVDFYKDGEKDVLTQEVINIFNYPTCDVCHELALYTNYLKTEYYCEQHVPKII